MEKMKKTLWPRVRPGQTVWAYMRPQDSEEEPTPALMTVQRVSENLLTVSDSRADNGLAVIAIVDPEVSERDGTYQYRYGSPASAEPESKRLFSVMSLKIDGIVGFLKLASFFEEG